MMNVYLIKSPEISPQHLIEIAELLNNVKGPINFIVDSDAQSEFKDILQKEYLFVSVKKGSAIIAKRLHFANASQAVTWEFMFNICEAYRQQKGIDRQSIVILLTDNYNVHNWFCGGDGRSKNNFFVHTGCWDSFMDCEKKFPIAYHTATAILKLAMVEKYSDISKYLHKEAIGCMMDFCRDKKEVTLKLRTGDICGDCLELINSKNVKPAYVKQILGIFDSIRKQMMFIRRFKGILEPSKILIRGCTKRIFLTDLSNQEVHLTPLEKTIWLLFLSHPEGIAYNQMDRYKTELLDYYKKLSVEDNVEFICQAVNRLCNLLDNSSLREKISSCNRKFKNSVGEEMAVYYQIRGERGDKKYISLNRHLVTIE